MLHRLALVAVTVVGCKSGGPSKTSSTAAPAAGPQPIISIAVWPSRWSAIAALPQLRALGTDAPSSFWAGAHEAAGEIGLASLALPPPGIDENGPVTLEIDRPHATFEAIALATAKHGTLAPEDRVGLRVRITIPANDPGALAGALSTAIAARTKQRPELRVVRGDHAVAIDVFTDDQVPTALTFEPAAIALPFDAGHDSAARAVVRVNGLADLGATSGMLRAMTAIAAMQSAEVGEVLAAGTSEVLVAYLLPDPATSVTDAVFADLPVTGPPQVAFALTEAGRAALTAGGLAPGKPVALDSVKWTALLAAAPRTPLITGTGDGMTQVATLFQKCGMSCFMYMATGNALSLAPALGTRDVGTLLKGTLDQAGIQAGELAWTASGLVFAEPAGATPPPWGSLATGATAPTAAETCYRKALLPVRSALDAAMEAGPEAIRTGLASLDGAASCTNADPIIAARYHAMHELLAQLAAMPRAPHTPPPPEDTN